MAYFSSLMFPVCRLDSFHNFFRCETLGSYNSNALREGMKWWNNVVQHTGNSVF